MGFPGIFYFQTIAVPLFLSGKAAMITSMVQCDFGALSGAEEHITDCEFLYDITEVIKVRIFMGYEVVGYWLNEEVKENLALLDEMEDTMRTLKGSERSRQRAGHEYTLWMSDEEVIVCADQLEFADDEMEGGMDYYDEESLSLCSVEDFFQVVAAYRNFAQQK